MALVPFPAPGRPDDDRIELTDPEELDDSSRMSFLEHLDELRKRLIYSVYALLGGCAIAFLFVGRIQHALWTPLVERLQAVRPDAAFMYTAGFEPFMLTMKI